MLMQANHQIGKMVNQYSLNDPQDDEAEGLLD